MADDVKVHRFPRLVVGVGCSARIAEEAHALGRKVMIVSDASMSALGTTGRVADALRGQGMQVEVFDDIHHEPDFQLVARVAGAMRSAGTEVVVALGGGSALDLGKLAAAMAANEGMPEEFVGVDSLPRKGLPVLAVPTTAGTGSEVTPIAIFTNTARKVKQGVVSPHLVPDVAFVDPLLTLSCPSAVTRAAGVDALTHCLEAYLSLNATLLTDAHAFQGIRLVGRSILRAVFHGTDVDARSDLAIGALLGGMAFAAAGVGAVHALSYPLSGTYHASHGDAIALLLLPVMRFNLPSALEKFSDIAGALGVDTCGLPAREAAHLAIRALEDLGDDLSLPRVFAGLDRSAIDSMVSEASQQTRLLQNNPRPLGDEDFRAIYRQLLPAQPTP